METENAEVLADEAMQEALKLAQDSTRSPIHHLPQPPDALILHSPLNLSNLCGGSGSPGGSRKTGWSTSKDWLQRQGLKARKLGLFQVGLHIHVSFFFTTVCLNSNKMRVLKITLRVMYSNGTDRLT